VVQNSILEVVFNKALDPTSLGQVTLSSSGTPVPATATLAWSNSAVRVTPSALLQASTNYTLTIAGVKDLAGNVIANQYSFNFTTGTTTESSQTQFVSASVTVAGASTPLTANLANVDVGTAIQLTFSQPIDPASFTYGTGVTLTDTSITDYNEQNVPLSLATVSADQMTVSLAPNANLGASSNFQLRINNGNGGIYDTIGNYIVNGATYNFSTGTATTATGTALPVYSTGLGAGGTGQLAGGSADPNWSASNTNSCCVYSGPAAVLSSSNLYSGWNVDTANSQWISWSDTHTGGPAGYTFTQSFDLTGFDPSTAAIQGTLWVDDGAYLYLNGQQIVYADNTTWSATGQPGVPFSIGPGSGLFQTGVNTLSVVLTSSDNNYEGINVLIQSATAAPKTGNLMRSQDLFYASNRTASGLQTEKAFLQPMPGIWDITAWLTELSLFDAPLKPEKHLIFQRSLNLGSRDRSLHVPEPAASEETTTAESEIHPGRLR
jgi:Bacterial Ig-like domain